MTRLDRLLPTAAALAVAAIAAPAFSADWSDTSMGFRTGTKYAEPFNANAIEKNILNLNHVSGYKYGSNFFNVDLLLSDKKDPAGAGSTNGASEVYIVYRHTLEYGKLTGKPVKFGPIKDIGAVLGFDANAKTDAGYNSKKRMLVAGGTMMMDVPGFLNIGLVALWESNAPYNTFSKTSTPRYTYDTHPMLTAAWAIPLPVGLPLSFEGFANVIAAKGKNEFGAETSVETNIDMQIMYDLSGLVGAGKNSFKLGFEYQYWKNKFGNNASGPAGKGAFAKTPMIRAEYHF